MIKRFDGSNFIDDENIRRFDRSNWIDTETNMRWDGSNWIEFYSNTPKIKLLREYGILSSKYTLLSKTKISAVLVRDNTSNSHYSVFYCPDILISKGSNVSYIVNIEKYPDYDSGIGVGYSLTSDLSNSTTTHYTEKGQNAGSFRAQNDCFFSVRFISNYLANNAESVIQVDSVTINGKTYNPEFKVN